MTFRSLARRVVVLFCVLFLPAVAWAQSESGSVTGVARDTSGAVLPGVTVEAASPALIEKVRVVVTDSQGLYRIVDLRPGRTPSLSLCPASGRSGREGIELTAGFTATVNAEMQVGTVEETVTVTGEAPLVDVAERRAADHDHARSAGLRSRPADVPRSSSRSFLGPNGGQAPTFHDVGGVGSDRGFFGVHGQRADDMTYNFGGMDSRVFSGGGFQYNAHTFEEVVVETAAGSAEATTGGVQINIVPKDGGNTFSGTMSGEFTRPQLVEREPQRRPARPRPDGGAVGQRVLRRWRRHRRPNQARTSYGFSHPAAGRIVRSIRWAITTTSARGRCSTNRT